MEPKKFASFCTAKETVNKTKRQPTEWEKIFVYDMTNKELISNTYICIYTYICICIYIYIYIYLIQLKIQKKTTSFESGQKI